MPIFIHDHSCQDKGNMLEALKRIKDVLKIPDENVIGWPGDFNCKRSIVFVHAGDDTGRRRDDWVDIANSSEVKYVVLVSTAGVVDVGSGNDAVYCVKDDINDVVRKISDSDLISFRESFEQNGKPNWKIFEPLIWPKMLLAAYLIDLARCKNGGNINTDALEPVWKSLEEQSKQEFLELGGEANNWNDPGTRVQATCRIFQQFADQG